MELDNKLSEPFPETRAEYRAMCDRERIAGVIRGQASRPIEMARHLWPDLGDGTLQAIHRACAEFERAAPIQASTKDQVALHEAGHFVAYQATGMVAASAEIGSSKRGRGGWGGSAGPWNRPVMQTMAGLYPFKADDVLAEAVSCLAGPANELRAGGHLYSSSGEMIEACLLARRRGEILGINFARAMLDVLACTTALLDRHAHTINSIADLLIRRRRVMYFDKPVEKLLAGVPPTFLAGPWPCNPWMLQELAAVFVRAPIDLPALMREIAPGVRL